MKNDMRKTTIITTIVCLIPVLAGIILYDRLPDVIATHWDIHGVANGWQPKFVGVVVYPGILVIVNLMIPFLMRTDPKYGNMGTKIKTLIHWIIPIVCIFCSATTLAEGLGYNSKIELTGPLFVGLIFILVGNYLPKTKQTYTVGIKLPWTLSSEDNWDKTHRMAGFLWVACGLIMMISAFLPGTMMIITVLFIIMVAVPIIYSYVLFRKGKK